MKLFEKCVHAAKTQNKHVKIYTSNGVCLKGIIFDFDESGILLNSMDGPFIYHTGIISVVTDDAQDEKLPEKVPPIITRKEGVLTKRNFRLE